MKYGILAIITAAATLTALSCGARQGTELMGRVTFLSGEVSINDKPCEFGAPVKAGDIVATGNRSLAVLQFGESSVINLKEKTSLKIDALVANREGDTITIHQKIGSTFNRIAKKGTNYSIRTQTSVAAVRGTSFSCTVSERGSAIRLSTGHVRIVPVIRGAAVETAAVDLDAGKKIETAETGASIPADLTEREARDMKSLDAIAIIPDIEKEGTLETIKKQPETARPVVIPVEIIQVIQAESGAESAEKKVTITLKNIQDRYGSISVITTTEGASYTGAFAQEGDQMKIFTTNGTVKVPSSRISNVSRYRGEIK